MTKKLVGCLATIVAKVHGGGGGVINSLFFTSLMHGCWLWRNNLLLQKQNFNVIFTCSLALSSSIFYSREVFRRQAQLLFALWKIARYSNGKQL